MLRLLSSKGQRRKELLKNYLNPVMLVFSGWQKMIEYHGRPRGTSWVSDFPHGEESGTGQVRLRKLENFTLYITIFLMVHSVGAACIILTLMLLVAYLANTK